MLRQKSELPTAAACYLAFNDGQLSLQQNDRHAPAATAVDFSGKALTYRRLTTGKSQGIAQAVGVRKLKGPRVLDATAGLGRDAFILAFTGCQVTLLEQSALIHALLEDGFRRGALSADGVVRETLNRMQLLHTRAGDYFDRIERGLVEVPDVIYLDPMYPQRTKTARVKKDIEMLQKILPKQMDFDELLQRSRSCARYRVVVKRPGSKTAQSSLKPDFQVPGKTSHFDVYLGEQTSTTQS
ncbi:MAG: class I SAM-dependent methyltransferase [Pseudomonadales bacterium]|nr:class I SAM-dependent methyltransferase [Pseudomonadales bacterium]